MSGLARAREWDATAVLQARELEGADLAELEFRAHRDALVAAGDVADSALEPFAAALDAELERPYAARAVRRGRLEWAVAGRAINAELVSLHVPERVSSLELAVSPDGERSASADGAPVEGPADVAVLHALAELERRGRERFQSFAARADRLRDGRWEITVDPL